ncbi:MAG: hypothetical protein Q9163_002757 [Psora crenata]
MAFTGHTYGPSCLLHAQSNTFTRRASEVSAGPPLVKAQYFYCSTLPIDDPLSPVPPPNSGSAKPARVPPQPFSINDNRALEEAWLALHNPDHIRSREIKRSDGVQEKETTTRDKSPKSLDNVAKIVKAAHEKGRVQKQRASNPEPNHGDDSTTGSPTGATILEQPIQQAPQNQSADEDLFTYAGRIAPGCPTADRIHNDGPDLTLCDEPNHIPFDETMPIGSEEIDSNEFESGLKKKRSFSPFRRKDKAEKKPKQKADIAPYGRLSRASQKAQDVQQLGSSPSERDTTGTPFLRVPSRLRRSRSRSRSPDSQSELEPIAGNDARVDGGADSPSRSPSRPNFQHLRPARSRERSREHSERHLFRHKPKKVEEVKVLVGVSRLHVVEMPSLKMGPIYWDPVHDVSSVVRGTWFYKETMWPVECDLANQLEEGYEYIKPWTLSYADELNSCQEIGPEAELKVVHRIWPPDELGKDPSRPTTAKDKRMLLDTAENQLGANESKHKTAIVAAEKPENRAAGVLNGFDDPVRLFAKSSVIYADSREAQILQPSQLPSVARGRRPLAKIRKGQAVGVTVIRGFDYKMWEKIYPPSKKAAAQRTARSTQETLRAATSASSGRKTPCSACMSMDEVPKVTDLVLVIHGIGQKLSERVESFHFTHAINAFRRQLNMELQAEAVKPWLRPELGSIMVLPVNWRSKVKLEDGFPDPACRERDADPNRNHYSLRDITPDSLPAVRNMISDVMLDIPYYLSHHKPLMIEGVIKEANRIYRLWCNNNPGFQETGRVHLITHSLGSVMALDILSKQPTRLPKQLDFKTTKVRTDIFEFDTKSLFFCGSPAGFFLLLNHVPLLPRKGRDKPEADGEDNSAGVAGNAGTYGCLAVDNLYNVMHQYDPIAYRLNGTVDVAYANSLQSAFVPSATASWAQYFGSMFKGKTVAPTTKALTNLDQFPQRPSMAHMPSTVELETHNFTREEIAEKRFYLLNDNGQIDYTLKSGGGPLEIQYLNMLSAHSSYWTSRDFVRFLVVEIGRKPGKNETVSSIKAAKKAWVKR